MFDLNNKLYPKPGQIYKHVGAYKLIRDAAIQVAKTTEIEFSDVNVIGVVDVNQLMMVLEVSPPEPIFQPQMIKIIFFESGSMGWVNLNGLEMITEDYEF